MRGGRGDLRRRSAQRDCLGNALPGCGPVEIRPSLDRVVGQPSRLTHSQRTLTAVCRLSRIVRRHESGSTLLVAVGVRVPQARQSSQTGRSDLGVCLGLRSSARVSSPESIFAVKHRSIFTMSTGRRTADDGMRSYHRVMSPLDERLEQALALENETERKLAVVSLIDEQVQRIEWRAIVWARGGRPAR
jgi:hypothetical protein